MCILPVVALAFVFALEWFAFSNYVVFSGLAGIALIAWVIFSDTVTLKRHITQARGQKMIGRSDGA